MSEGLRADDRGSDRSEIHVRLGRRVVDAIRAWYARDAMKISAAIAAGALITAFVVGPSSDKPADEQTDASLQLAGGVGLTDQAAGPSPVRVDGSIAGAGSGESGGRSSSFADHSTRPGVDDGASGPDRLRSSSVAGAEVDRSEPSSSSTSVPNDDGGSVSTGQSAPTTTTVPPASTTTATPATPSSSTTTAAPPTPSTSTPVTSTTRPPATSTTTTVHGGWSVTDSEYVLLSFDAGSVPLNDPRLATYGASLDAAASSCTISNRTTLGLRILAAAELLRTSGVNESALDVTIRLRIAGEASLIRQPCVALLDSIVLDLLGG